MSSFRLDVVSLVPEVFDSLRGLGVIGRAFGSGIAELHTHNPRDYATDRYRKVDDEPYGGGAGMVSNLSRCLPPLKRSLFSRAGGYC